MVRVKTGNARANQLLSALNVAVRDRIEPHLEEVKFALGEIVCEAGGTVRHAYFPEGAVLSLLTVMETGEAIETANIGYEGAFGLFSAFSAAYGQASFSRCMVQFAGRILRCKIEVLQAEFLSSATTRQLFVGYGQTLVSQVQQTAGCNAVHTVQQRMCRWLLTMHDRAEGPHLTYTHALLSEMLGSNRKTITLAAQSMQSAGLISYQRGAIQVLDRPGLEKFSCECYGTVKAQFSGFLDAQRKTRLPVPDRD